MAVPVVRIGHMRVVMRQRRMLVWMRVRLVQRGRMRVLMMLVVDVDVVVLQHLVGVHMAVMLADQQSHAGGHDDHCSRMAPI